MTKRTWKELAESVVAMVMGEKELPNDEGFENLNSEINEIIGDVGIDELLPYTKKLLNLNIVNKGVNFKILEKLPVFWRAVYDLSINLVAVEAGQIVMGK